MPVTARTIASLALVVACASLAGCGDDVKPTAPTPVTVTALAVSALPASLRAGATHQLTATATLSNGQTAQVGFPLTWASSDTGVATVNSGLVLARADGRATITAASGRVSAAVDLLVRGGRILTGHVFESPSNFVPIAGARVTVSDGLYAGASATTDGFGVFLLTDVNGVLNLRVSAPNFEDAQVTGDTRSVFANVSLVPRIRRITDRADWIAPPGDSQWRFQSAMTFTVQRSGPVDLFTAGIAAPTGDDFTSLCSELRGEDNRLLWSFTASWQARTTLALDGGRRYELKIRRCGSVDRPLLHESTLIAVHQ